MAKEDLTGPNVFIANLVPANPTDDDWQREGAAHIRGIKNVLQNSLPGVSQAYDLAAMLARISALEASLRYAVPTGLIAYMHAASSGWVLANGQTWSKAALPKLWAYAAAGFLTGDQVANPGLYKDLGGDNFAVPKLDGLFIRCGGSYNNSTDNASGAMGAVQGSQNLAHQHGLPLWTYAVGGGGAQGWLREQQGGSKGYTDFDTGGTESRPINVALYPVIYAM
jgi:hypothetical protein